MPTEVFTILVPATRVDALGWRWVNSGAQVSCSFGSYSCLHWLHFNETARRTSKRDFLVCTVLFQLLNTQYCHQQSDLLSNSPCYSKGCCAGYDFYFALHLQREQVYMIYLVLSHGLLRDRCHGSPISKAVSYATLPLSISNLDPTIFTSNGRFNLKR